ncbi:MAG: hypothetical protein JW895_10615, partial [Thermoleophilaceae bacterium]|nr:hypothetical protein [Thermoleophilaceae bacterium]
HAIQDAQIPGFPLSDSAAAIGEGFGDYFASALSATFTPRAGFDGCWDEWDAFASGLGNCLRRVDWNLRPGQASSDCPDVTEEHCAGEVWSGALWAIRNAIGGRTADRLVLQSHFSLTATASFGDAARALFAADRALYGGAHRFALAAVLASRGLIDAERLDDTPADAVPLGVPARLIGRLARGGDEHDVYALALGAGQPVVIRLSPAADFDLRLLAAGAVSLDAPPIASSEGAGNEVLRFTPRTAGRYVLDVRAIEGSGQYVLETVSDDRDRDGVADASDLCPLVADPRQRDWDNDGRGDLCDRSARIRIARVMRRGKRVRVRAQMWPSALPARAMRLHVGQRVCRRSCRFRRLRSVRPPSAINGHVNLGLKLRPGRYRLTAVVSAKGFRSVRSRSRGISVPG